MTAQTWRQLHLAFILRLLVIMLCRVVLCLAIRRRYTCLLLGSLHLQFWGISFMNRRLHTFSHIIPKISSSSSVKSFYVIETKVPSMDAMRSSRGIHVS